MLISLSSTGSYRNLAQTLNGSSVLEMVNYLKKEQMMILDSIKAKYFPTQLLLPAKKGMKEYGSWVCVALGCHLSGLKTWGSV